MKLSGGKFKGAAERFVRSLIIAELHILNAQAVQGSDKRRIDSEGAFELLDCFVAMTILHGRERFVVEVNGGLRGVGSDHTFSDGCACCGS